MNARPHIEPRLIAKSVPGIFSDINEEGEYCLRELERFSREHPYRDAPVSYGIGAIPSGECCNPDGFIPMPESCPRCPNRAMPSARARQASPRAVLRRLGHAVPIAIAVFCAVYFAGQLLRAVLA